MQLVQSTCENEFETLLKKYQSGYLSDEENERLISILNQEIQYGDHDDGEKLIMTMLGAALIAKSV
jgi:hypothetical protein